MMIEAILRPIAISYPELIIYFLFFSFCPPMHFIDNEEALTAYNAHELAQEEVKPDLKQATSDLQLKEKESICNVKDAIILALIILERCLFVML